MHELTENNTEQEYIISSKTLNKIIKLLEDKPFKVVVGLLNEIKAVPSNETNEILKDNVKNNNNGF